MSVTDFLSSFAESEKEARPSRVEAVRINLARILSTRQGMVLHLPDYGMPDIHQIFLTMPKSLDELERAITEVIAHYEPRLSHCRVKRDKSRNEDDFVAEYRIEGRVGRESVVFQAKLYRDGHTEATRSAT